MGFKEDISKFVRKTEDKLTTVFRKSCKTISEHVALMTGVDTGRLLANYQPGVNRPCPYPNVEGGTSSWVDGVKDITIMQRNRTRALSKTLPRIELITKMLKLQDTYWFITSEKYAPYVEYIGWKKTPPYRMFARARMEWDNIVKHRAREVGNV